MNILLFRIPSTDFSRDCGDEDRFASVAAVLQAAGFSVHCETSPYSERLRECIRHVRPDFAYTPSARFPGADAEWVHAVFEEFGLPYVGSTADVIELCLKKQFLKRRWREKNIETPGWTVSNSVGAISDLSDIDLPGFPLIAKPVAGGNSDFISDKSVFLDKAEFFARFPGYAEGKGEFLLERFLGFAPDRREFTIALLGEPGNGLILPVEITLIEKRAVPLVSGHDKNTQRTKVGKVQPGAFRDELEAFSRDAFMAAGVRDYARLDVMFAEGRLHAIEINGQPMIPDRWFRYCAAEAGLAMTYMQSLFSRSIERARREGDGG